MSRRRVVVAEDNEEMRMLVVQALTREGFDVHAVGDTLSLRRALERESFALLVSDLRMPGGSGLAFIAELRNAGNEIPALLMTAFGDVQTRKKAESLGALLFDKPFDLQFLRDAARELARK